MIVDGYIRVSKVRGRKGPSFISPDQQRDQIATYCRLHGYELAMVHEELDQSGGKRDRPLLKLAIDRIAGTQSSGLIVAKVDRFGRSLVDGLALIEQIQAAGGMFASVMDSFDTSTPNGRFVLRMMLNMAEFELDRVRENFADARQRAVARGVHPCVVPNAGYRKQESGVLEPVPELRPTIQEIYRQAAEGIAWKDIAEYAMSAGLTTAYGNAHWSSRAIKLLVRNPVYLGMAHHGEFENPNAHEPLVDEATWRRAQRPGRLHKARSDRPALLASLARCGSCRYGMATYLEKKTGVRRYRCHTYHARGRCPEPVSLWINTGLEDIVVERFFHAVGAVTAIGAAPDQSRLAELQNAADAAECALSEYRDDQEVIVMLGIERYRAGLRKFATAAEEAQTALHAEHERLSGVLPMPVAELRQTWSSLDVREQQTLLSLAIDAIFVMPGDEPLEDRVHICLRGEAPDDMPRRGRKGAPTLRPFVPPVRAV